MKSTTLPPNNDQESSDPKPLDLQQTERRPPPPAFDIKQRVLARDEQTFFLYEAAVRKQMYAPKSKKVNVFLEDGESDSDDEDFDCANTEISDEYCWHYFVHYMNWNVKWDRWVQEDGLYKDNIATRAFQKRVKDESKSKTKKKSKLMGEKELAKFHRKLKQMELQFQKKEKEMVMTEEELKDWILSVDQADNNNDGNAKEKEKKETQLKMNKSKTLPSSNNSNSKNKNLMGGFTKAFLERESTLRFKNLRSSSRQKTMRQSSSKQSSACVLNLSLNLPFTIKKVLTDEWEVISQCEMLHKLPASMTVSKVLNAYLKVKLESLRVNTIVDEARRDDQIKLDSCPTMKEGDEANEVSTAANNQSNENAESSSSSSGMESQEQQLNNYLEPKTPEESEWKDMTDGLAIFFNEALPVQLLYRHEIPQRIVLDTNHPDESYCDLYPCEHLLRLLLYLPDLIEDHHQRQWEEKRKAQQDDAEWKDEEEARYNKIIFKIGDLVRFVQKHQNDFLLQKFRKPIEEESAKYERMKVKLGLVENMEAYCTLISKESVTDTSPPPSSSLSLPSPSQLPPTMKSGKVGKDASTHESVKEANDKNKKGRHVLQRRSKPKTSRKRQRND